MRKHLGYYLSFFLILGLGIFAIFQSQGDKSLQFKFTILLGGAYILWGILHHLVHHSVTLRIVIEYIIVALLGVAVVFFLLNGGI